MVSTATWLLVTRSYFSLTTPVSSLRGARVNEAACAPKAMSCWMSS